MPLTSRIAAAGCTIGCGTGDTPPGPRRQPLRHRLERSPRSNRSSEGSTRAFLQTPTSAPGSLCRIVTLRKGCGVQPFPELSSDSAPAYRGPQGMLACTAQLPQIKTIFPALTPCLPSSAVSSSRAGPTRTGMSLGQKARPALSCWPVSGSSTVWLPGGSRVSRQEMLRPLSQQRPLGTRP